ncbi:uncharacterized protein LOC121387499 [Gigantopelta aegis]|uniref:uncharacterized protein LOC121387499 n=1 Tax=Gigantopelta aegis TaxID=1735272 RepID=UPI001B88A13D|nr:uncharacterized protein LOC121387499 [Gigantopelta aegis]
MSKCWSFLLLAASWLCFKTDSVAGICSPRMYGSQCNYTCHCDDVDCDDVTGCSRRCDRGWHGSNCNKENIALHSQSSYDPNWRKDPSLAVDGNLDQGYQAANCIVCLQDPVIPQHGGRWTWVENITYTN